MKIFYILKIKVAQVNERTTNRIHKISIIKLR